jgi:hypothetical protein
MRFRSIIPVVAGAVASPLLGAAPAAAQEGTWRVESVMVDFGTGLQDLMAMQGIDSAFLYIDAAGLIEGRAYGATENGEPEVMGTLTTVGDELVFEFQQDGVDSGSASLDGDTLVLSAEGTENEASVTITIIAIRVPSDRDREEWGPGVHEHYP